MNKLLTFPGLQPIYLGDFDFLQQSVNDAFLQLLRGLTGQDNPKCILKAATPEKNGAICFNGEILPLKYFRGAVIDTLVYKVESSYSGERTFKDGKTENCYETRYVVGVSGSTLDENRSSNFPALQDLLTRSAIKPRTGSVRYDNDKVITTLSYGKIDNIYIVEGKFAVLEDASVNVIMEDMSVILPTGIKTFPVTINNNGVMKIVPGKMEIIYNETADANVVKISIVSTSLEMDAEGSFSVNIIE